MSLGVTQRAAAAVDSTPVFPRWIAHAAPVTCPGQAPRVLTSEQAATFLQSWLPDSLYRNLPEQKPPANLPKCTITMRLTVGGTDQPNLLVYYVSDGHSAWISSNEGRWVIAPQSQRVILSFEGRGTYLPVVLPSTTVPGTTAPARSNSQVKKSNQSSTPLIVLVVAILVGGVVLLVVRRSRRA
jgi:hypothetical protein